MICCLRVRTPQQRQRQWSIWNKKIPDNNSFVIIRPEEDLSALSSPAGCRYNGCERRIRGCTPAMPKTSLEKPLPLQDSRLSTQVRRHGGATILKIMYRMTEKQEVICSCIAVNILKSQQLQMSFFNYNYNIIGYSFHREL